jgi:hypothetical protein
MTDHVKIEKADRETARARPLKLLAQGKERPVVYTILRHVSASGMQRRIDLYILEVDEKTGTARPRYISGWAAAVLGDKCYPENGIKVNGCGMDMGFSLVYNLSMALYNPGPKYDKDKAYSLKQEWM